MPQNNMKRGRMILARERERERKKKDKKKQLKTGKNGGVES